MGYRPKDGAQALLAALVLVLAQATSLASAYGADSLSASIGRSLRETQQLAVELEVALERLRQETAKLRETLLSETRAQEPLKIDADELRLTQLDVETLDARLVALTSRIAQQRREMAGLQNLPAGAVDKGLLDDLRHAQEQVLDALEQAHRVLMERRDLAGEHLATLYTRMDLRANQQRYTAAQDPRLVLTERVIAALVRQAILSANQAATYDTSDPASLQLARARVRVGPSRRSGQLSTNGLRLATSASAHR